jgi:hypothetical protein
MRAFDVEHLDPQPLARAAAVRSGSEQDARTRESARTMSMASRLRTAFEMSRFGSQLRNGRR